MMNSLLIEVTILCFAAVSIVPIFKKIGLGQSIAYIFAGALIGPQFFGLVFANESIEIGSELGIIFLLFIVGLGITPTDFASLQKPIFLLGSLQVGVTALVITAFDYLIFKHSLVTASVVGLGLSLSSTAFGFNHLRSKGLLGKRVSDAPVGVLIFQDLMVVPILVYAGLMGGSDQIYLNPEFALAFTLLFLFYFSFSDRLIRYVDKADAPEIFTATALLVVTAASFFSKMAFGTTSIGALAAGIALARSSHRGRMEDSIYPFKGMLLGLFFITVGINMPLQLLWAEPLPILLGVFGLLSLKFLINLAVNHFTGYRQAWVKNSLLISQAGEFGFIIFALATKSQLLDAADADRLILTIGLSMLMVPILLKVFQSRLQTIK